MTNHYPMVSAGVYAVTPGGQRIDPDGNGVLRCSPDDEIVMLGAGGGGGASDTD